MKDYFDVLIKVCMVCVGLALLVMLLMGVAFGLVLAPHFGR